jgi:hypothetical protein
LEAFRVKAVKIFAMVIVAGLLAASSSRAQDKKEVNLAAAPPKIALLEHKQPYSGKSEERRKLEETLSAASDRFEAPRFWIDLESLSGEPEALVFSPFDSYEQMEQSDFEWSQFLAGHADLQRTREDTKGLVGGERKIIAVRRDDLGYLADTIDLSEARFMQVLEVRLFPGRENDFADAFKILADAHLKVQADTPWVVYEVDAGLPAPTFLVLSPMEELKQRDDLLALAGSITDAEGESGETLKKIARESYASTENTVYVINPAMSHVSKAFAATDLDFWMHRNPAAAPQPKAEAKPEAKAKPKAAN